jgi:hypothetical protein
VAPLTAEQSIHVPHELPGQDPEGGSEVNFGGDESSSVSGTPRADPGGDLSRRTSDFSTQFAMDGRPSTDGGGAAGSSGGGAGGSSGGGAGGSSSGGGAMNGGASAAAAPSTPEPPGGANGGPPADGLGGSWQDLVTLRNQSVMQRLNPLQHFSEVRAGVVDCAGGVCCTGLRG